jgi:hypothetical protein
MKKIKELNLNPGYDLDSYPVHKRNQKINIGHASPSMSADSHYSRNVMQRVNKNMIEKENDSEEELDNFVDSVNLIKEFSLPSLDLSSGIKDRVLSLGKTGLMSIPIFGDLFALTKFLFTIHKLRRASRKFTKKLSSLTEIDLGDDFLEPEGSMSSESLLTSNIAEASNRLSNLKDYPELDITMIDIHNLSDRYFQVFRYCKDAIMEFIGFADAPFGQSGAYLNIGISTVTYSSFPDFLLGTYANYIDDLTMLAEEKTKEENKEFSGLINFFKELTASLISVPRRLMDFLGNLDILINKEKLERLAMIHNALSSFSDIDTNEEKYNMGLDATPGTSYFDFVKSMGVDINQTPEISDMSLSEDVKKMAFYLKEEYSLLELYEDEDEEDESVEEHFVAGGTATIGKKLDGTVETPSQRKARNKQANIYAEEVRKIQEWNLKTIGRIK